MTYAQLSLTIMGIIAYVSVWLSVGVFICWVWFGEGKGDILVLMCYILHNSAYPFCKSVIDTEIVMAINNEFLNSQGQASKVTFM